jgi:hypothetical protein
MKRSLTMEEIEHFVNSQGQVQEKAGNTWFQAVSGGRK